MKKALFILAAAALFLTGCNGFTKTNSEDDTTKNNNNTVVSGLAQYEQKVIDIKQIPETAVLQDSNSQYALYVNLEQEPSEDDFEGTYSVLPPTGARLSSKAAPMPATSGPTSSTLKPRQPSNYHRQKAYNSSTTKNKKSSHLCTTTTLKADATPIAMPIRLTANTSAKTANQR